MGRPEDDGAYRAYLRSEWDAFCRDPAPHMGVASTIRRHASSVVRVLDVGTGAGQELIPFLGDAWCCGIDLSEQSPHLARAWLTEVAGRDVRLAFVRADAHTLPFASGSIDVVICRLVLPYLNHAVALAEFARVLRPGGILSTEVHGPVFYMARLRQAIALRDPRRCRKAIAALSTGLWFHLTDQHRTVARGGETFVTVRMLTRLASRAGLDLVEQVDNHNSRAPHLLFRHRQDHVA